VLAVNSGRTGYEFVNQPTTPDLSDYVLSVNDETPDENGNIVLDTELIPENQNLYYTDARFDTRYATKTHYHNRYSTEAETARSGATANVELYYTARPDGDGLAESETSDVGETDTINRTLFYSTKFDADPDTAGDWTQYTTQPANNATFATAKAALLAGLNDTDATAETRGTLPLSLKMVRTVGAVVDLLLDTYTGAAVAYSVRKLDKDYTGSCMRVRRASDDAETDIGFDSNGDLDTSAISTHGGASACFVTTWYDQSGNNNNATQSTSGNQPQIYNGTAVTTLNTKPSVTFSGSTHMTFTTWSPGAAVSAFWVAQNEAATASWTFVGPNNNQWAPISTSTFRTRISGFYTWAWSVSASAQYLSALIRNSSSDGTFHYNGNTSSTTRNFTDTISINSLSNGANGLDGGIQEVVLWSADQSTNRTGIESDINTYFSIYTP